jgi:archaellin
MSTTQAACDSFSWNGTNYAASGTYTQINSVCDVDTLYLTISPTAGNSTTQVACRTYTWNGTDYSSSGTYTYANSTCNVDTLFLTINTIDTTITIESNVLTANQLNANYQWYDCETNSIIAGATNQDFFPLATGFYYVLIEKNSCIDSSACVEIMLWGIEELDESVLQIAPNPTRDFIQFTTNELLEFTKIELLDFTGKTVINSSEEEIKQQRINVSSLTTGVYLIRFNTDLQQITKKVIIE